MTKRNFKGELLTSTMSRRLFVGGIACFVGGCGKKNDDKGDKLTIGFNVQLHWPSNVVLRDAHGNQQALLGQAISIPQGCRSEVYGTKEWIRQITFVPDGTSSDDALDAQNHLAVDNDPVSIGCGHVSKNVQLMKAFKTGSGLWFEKPYAKSTFYCLVDKGTTSGGKFVASEISISAAPWDINWSEYGTSMGLGKENPACPV